MVKTLAPIETPPVGTAEHDRLAEPNPHEPGKAYWRLAGSGRPIWAIIMHFYMERDVDDPTLASAPLIAKIADDFAIPEAEVRAALAYYAEHRKFIDAVLTLNSDGEMP